MWTTTPWTLVSNAAVAVDPELTYVRAKTGALEAPVVLAEALVERCSARAPRSLDRFPGARLDGARYEPPFPLHHRRGVRRARATPSCSATSSPPRTAPASCTPRSPSARTTSASAQQHGLTVVNPVRLDGTYDERIGPYAGRFVKDADADLVEDLRARGRLLRAGELRARLPALLALRHAAALLRQAVLVHRARRSCATACWPPTSTVDLAPRRTSSTGASATGWRTTSTGRSRASATGARRCRSGAARTATRPTCIGSFAELEELLGRAARATRTARTSTTSRFRVPGVRRARCAACPRSSTSGSTRARCRSRSGTRRSRTRSTSSARFPADYICEAIDQTRGWFYSLLAVSTLLFDRAPYEDVVCLGLILDERGPEDVASRKGNIVGPWDVLDRYGADAFRWYFFTSKQPWDGYRFSLDTVGEGVRQFLQQLWNTYGFYVLYANADGRGARRAEPSRADRPRPLGALAPGRRPSRSSPSASTTSTRRAAGRAIAAFVDDLSNWYVRRSRRRFWDGDPARVRDAARVPRHGRAAARAVHAVRRRRDLRQPRRRRASRCT